MSYSPWDLHDYVEERLTTLGFLPRGMESSNEEIWTAFDQLVERYQVAMKLLTGVVNSYEAAGCDGCGTIDESVNQSIVTFIYPAEEPRGFDV